MGFPDPPFMMTFDPDGKIVVVEPGSGRPYDPERVYYSEDGRPFKRVDRVSTWVEEDDD